MTTPRRELPPRYDAAAVEPAIYERWMAADAFRPADEAPSGAAPFVIIQPPPNVTGALHLGHAARTTVEDTLIRYHRMRGDDTLWLPGVDHASIAAQFVLDKILAEEGETRASLGRERYLERMWQYMDATRETISLQHRRLGASADWSRLRFTMDEHYMRCVQKVFVELYKKGLIYRGQRMVNWCPATLTALSDEEVEMEPQKGFLWHFKVEVAESPLTPSLSPGGGEGARRAGEGDSAWFMVPMRGLSRN